MRKKIMYSCTAPTKHVSASLMSVQIVKGPSNFLLTHFNRYYSKCKKLLLFKPSIVVVSTFC